MVKILTKEKKFIKGGKEEKKINVFFVHPGNLSDLKYNLMEACKTIEGFDVQNAYGNINIANTCWIL